MDETHQPIKYVGPDDKVMSIKATVSSSAQFVLCIRTPEKSLLDVIATIKQNVIQYSMASFSCYNPHSYSIACI